MGARTKFPELAIGDDQGPQSAQPLQCLVAMLLSGLLVHWGIGCANSLGVELCSLPDKVLKQIALVLGQQEVLGLGDNFAEIFYESLSLRRELVCGRAEGLGGEEAVESNIDLVVLARERVRNSQLASRYGLQHTDGTLPFWNAVAMP